MKIKQRKSGRQPLSYPAKIIANDRSWGRNCRLVDISNGGAMLVTEEPLDLPAEFMLALSGRITRRCQLRWSENCDVGVLFVR
jgi:PilZ domain-containing protein